MIKRMSVCAGVVLMCTLLLSAAEPPSVDIPEIRQFYEDLNFVANNSTTQERTLIAMFRRGLRGDDSFLNEPRLKSVAEKMDSLRSRGFGVDAGIHTGGAFESPTAYSFAADPVQIMSWSENHIALKVLRSSPRDLNPAIKEETLSGFQRQRLWGASFIQIDDWYLVDGQWRISEVHAFLIDA